MTEINEHDSCECGDYRRQHENGVGACRFNNFNGGHGMGGPCYSFKLEAQASAQAIAKLLEGK